MKLLVILAAALAASLSAATNLKTVSVSTLPELVIAMEDPMVGRIWVNKSISLKGEPLPTLKQRLLEIEGAPSCGIPCTLDAHGKSRIFQVGPGFGSGLILANLQLQNAFANQGNGSAITVYSDGVGGGASGDFCTFLNNTNTASDHFADGHVTNAGFGGAVYGGLKTQLEFDNSDFRNNGGANGGAVACYGCQMAIANSRYHANVASQAGGALFIEGGNGTLSLHNTVLQENNALSGGGGAVVLGAKADRKLFSLGFADSGISHATFHKNTAKGPGGALFGGPFATVAMHESVFDGNRGEENGGGMAMSTARPMAIANTTFVHNTVGFPKDMDAGDGRGQGGAGLSIGFDVDMEAAPEFAASVFHNVTFSANTIDQNDGKVAAAGAGMLINEGEIIIALSHFDKNLNLNAGDDSKLQEEDVCAYGQNTSVLFDEYAAGVCSSCRGKGNCPQNPKK